MIVTKYLVSIFLPWIAKTVIYHFAFRWRSIHATFQTKLIVAGVPLIVGGLWPFPLPPFILFLVGVGAGIYLCSKYTDGEMYPDIVGIVGGTEIVGAEVISGWIVPMLV